jgi:hypothetical protein
MYILMQFTQILFPSILLFRLQWFKITRTEKITCYDLWPLPVPAHNSVILGYAPGYHYCYLRIANGNDVYSSRCLTLLCGYQDNTLILPYKVDQN